jgi:hypothetical protein
LSRLRPATPWKANPNPVDCVVVVALTRRGSTLKKSRKFTQFVTKFLFRDPLIGFQEAQAALRRGEGELSAPAACDQHWFYAP